MMKTLGFDQIDGVFGTLTRFGGPGRRPIRGGPRTEAEVKAYQAQHALANDGEFGPRTWWVLAGTAGATLASLAGLTTV